VPNLQGKTDLVPGRTTVTWLEASEPGRSRGQCAEYCGLQHAGMALFVDAEPAADFEQWLARERQPADTVLDATAASGRAIFRRQCAYCHTVRGTTSAAQAAPDLTHLAGRRTLAAGQLPNTPEHLAAWISDPQRHKPGTKMPRVPLSAPELQAVVAYLGTLR
jgi:cytochrome c oxidase subunit 2